MEVKMATEYTGYIVIGVLIVIAFIIFMIIIKKRNKSATTTTGECKHDFKLAGVLLMYEKYPRICYYCTKCGFALHKPIIKHQA